MTSRKREDFMLNMAKTTVDALLYFLTKSSGKRNICLQTKYFSIKSNEFLNNFIIKKDTYKTPKPYLAFVAKINIYQKRNKDDN